VDERRGRLTRDGIRIHDAAEFEGMRVAGRVAAEILDAMGALVFPGQTTGEIDRQITAMVEARGAVSATIGYKGYQHASCISVNHVVCHGIPGDKVLKDGDILNIDVTVIVDGWYGDSSRMYVAGRPTRKAERLIQVTHDALMLGIEAARPGRTFGDIGAAIQSYVEGNRMSVVRDFCGMAWAGCSTRRRTCCTTAGPGRGRGSRRGCSSPSSLWSTSGGPRPRCCRTTGPRSRATSRCRRSSSIRWASPRRGRGLHAVARGAVYPRFA
jgi:methionine aminopeptidase type I